MKNKIIKYFPYLFLFILCVLFIFPVLTGKMYTGGDLYTKYFPWKTFLGDSVRSGAVPIWNPHIFSGMPFIADVQKGAFYPPGVFFLVLDFADAYRIYLLLHYVLLAFGMFALISALGFPVMPALMASAVSAFGSFALASSVSPAVLGPVALLPVTAYMLIRTAKTGAIHNFVLTALLVCLSFLSGHYPAFIYSVLFLILFGLYLKSETEAGQNNGRYYMLLVSVLCLSAIACIFLTMPQSGLYNDLLKNMVSAEELGYSMAAADSMGFSGLLGLFFPPVSQIQGFNDFSRYINGTMVFMSVTFIFLLIFSFFTKQDRLYRFSASVFVFSILLALGKNLPVHSLFYSFAPYLSFMLHPGYAVTLLIIPAAVITAHAARGLHAGTHSVKPARKMLTVFYGLLILFAFTVLNSQKIGALYGMNEQSMLKLIIMFACFLGIYGLNLGLLYAVEKQLIRKEFHSALVFSVIITELLLFSSILNPACPGRFYSRGSIERSEPAKLVKTSAFRYISTASGNVPVNCTEFDIYADTLPSNTGILYGLNDASGYNDLKNRAYSVLLNSAFNSGLPNLSALNMMSVKYIVSGYKLDGLGEPKKSGSSYVYKNRAALPIFHVSSDINAPQPIDSTASWTRKGKFDYSIYKARISCAKDGFAVFASSYYPGWNAYVDNRFEPISRCYGIYMAVPIDAGDHEVTFIYNPPSYKEYKTAFFIAFIAFFAAAVFYIRRRS